MSAIVAPSHANARLLLVDDQESSLLLLERLLHQAGYRHVRSLTDPRQVLDEVAAHPPDCLLLDVHMPHVSGLELLARLREQQAEDDFLPVLMVTAGDDESVKRRALEAGANEFLTKPVQGPELALRLANLLQLRDLTRSLAVQNQGLEERVRERTRELRQAAAHFEFLAELSTRVESAYDPFAVAREGLASLQKHFGLEAGMLYTVDGEGLTLSLVEGQLPEAFVRLSLMRRIPTTGALAGAALEAKGPVVVTNYSAWPQARPGFENVGLKTLMAVPLFLNSRPHSLMLVGSFQKELTEDPEHLVLLQAAARRVERALERSEHVRTLEHTKREALRVVGLTLEYRDYETKGHTDRVTELAQQLGRALGLDEASLRHLRWGGYLHDAGKVAIPDRILLKPGKLTAEEFAVVKGHVTIGEAMLRGLSFIPEPVYEVIRHHHERWDGRGYPDGLAGEAIPLLARVFAVVDVYDALTSERPYKRAWSHAEAVAELRQQAGRQFDPELVDTFLERVNPSETEAGAS